MRSKSASITEDSFWNAQGIVAKVLFKLKDKGLFNIIDNKIVIYRGDNKIDIICEFDKMYKINDKFILIEKTINNIPCYGFLCEHKTFSGFKYSGVNLCEIGYTTMICAMFDADGNPLDHPTFIDVNTGEYI